MTLPSKPRLNLIASYPHAVSKPLMRNLGEFFGHIAKGLRTDLAAPKPAAPKVVTRQTIEEEERQTPQGKVVLRRTIIEEVELPPGTPPPRGDQPPASSA